MFPFGSQQNDPVCLSSFKFTVISIQYSIPNSYQGITSFVFSSPLHHHSLHNKLFHLFSVFLPPKSCPVTRLPRGKKKIPGFSPLHIRQSVHPSVCPTHDSDFSMCSKGFQSPPGGGGGRGSSAITHTI